jgi:hypothetical protein
LTVTAPIASECEEEGDTQRPEEGDDGVSQRARTCGPGRTLRFLRCLQVVARRGGRHGEFCTPLDQRLPLPLLKGSRTLKGDDLGGEILY